MEGHVTLEMKEVCTWRMAFMNMMKWNNDSPFSNEVPAVNESSESCSALHAYKAFAFRGKLENHKHTGQLALKYKFK